MKKYSITIAALVACLALCAAAWPQSETIEEIPAPLQVIAVSAPESTVEEIATEAETTPSTEEKKAEIPWPEPLHEAQRVIPNQTPVHEEAPVIPEMPTTPVPEPTPAPEPAPSQTVTDPQPGDMIYIPGFGWLESQGPGEVVYAEDMYENGNKVGSMG